MTALGQLFWFVVSMFVLLAYLAILFQVVADLFRDAKMSGWGKAIWILALVFLPVLTALVYVIARGPGMARRRQAALEQAQGARDAYIRQTAGTGASAVDQIATAKTLLDAGAIDEEEFRLLKSKALGHPETMRGRAGAPTMDTRASPASRDLTPPVDQQH